jgi:hypothetical protein
MRHLRVLLSSLVLAFAACGGGSEPSAERSPPADALPSGPEETTEAPEPGTEGATTEEAEAVPEAPPGAPRYVAGYRGWVKLNDRPIPPRDADPHLGTKNVYASAERRPNGRFPYGTIVVKDATRPGKEFIGLIAIMRKERGADPAHNDWVFVEYAREARSERFGEIASGAVCWSCHMGAVQSDYVFTE